MRIKLIKTWKNINIYLIAAQDVETAGETLMNKFVSKNKDDIGVNEFGKPYLKSKEFWFNLTHTHGYAAIAISPNSEIGLDIERLDRKTDFRNLIMSKFNFQLYCKLNSQEEFVKQWTIRESAIKCYGDLTLNSIYKINNDEKNRILKCAGKSDIEYYVFNYQNICVCVSRKI
jgi:phosphopantetheinyl transferase